MMILLSNAALAYSKDGHPELPDHTAHRNNFLHTGAAPPDRGPPVPTFRAPTPWWSVSDALSRRRERIIHHTTPPIDQLSCCVPVSPIPDHQL